MNRWFRFYEEALDDPKVQRLSPVCFKSWINLLCISSKNGGRLPSIKDLSFSLRFQERRMKRIIEELIEAGLIDEDKHGLAPHSWETRQYKSDVSRDRQKRYRERHSDGDGDVTVTPRARTDSDSDSDSDTERVSLRSTPPTKENDFENRFWSIYPHKVGKRDAEKAWLAALKRGIKPVELIEGVEAYIRNKPADRNWCNPATWLNQDRYLDRPAVVVPVDFKKKREEENDPWRGVAQS